MGKAHLHNLDKRKNQIMHTPWEDDGWGLSAGIQAIRLSHHLYPKDIKYLIGFDIFGVKR